MAEETSERGPAVLETYTESHSRWFVRKPDGKVTQEEINQALLMDIRSLLLSIKNMAIFFTVLAVIALVVGFFFGIAVTH